MFLIKGLKSDTSEMSPLTPIILNIFAKVIVVVSFYFWFRHCSYMLYGFWDKTYLTEAMFEKKLFICSIFSSHSLSMGAVRSLSSGRTDVEIILLITLETHSVFLIKLDSSYIPHQLFILWAISIILKTHGHRSIWWVQYLNLDSLR